ncbi:MAG: AraC family transcriptional regulator [Bacteroidetes bacterium]|nr:AraC family transcriptional regulator [Bacteroidota bacterium]
MKYSKTIYIERINKVTDYVQNNLSESTSLDKLAKISGFSSFYFHRIFTAITGETVNFFTNRLRLEKAARLLKFSSNSTTHIAFECGFSSSATFSRSFKLYFGTTPNNYKKTGVIENSKICKELFPIDEYIIPMTSEQLKENFPVQIKEYPQRHVALIRVIGGYQENRVLNAFEQMVKWAKEMDLFDAGTIFGMSLDDPMVTPKDKYRYEVCLTIPSSVKMNTELNMSAMTMPKCKYAVTRVSGNINIVATATNYLFNDWLINSRYEPEHQHGLEIFLDKNNVCNWNHFDLDICIPIKPLNQY